MVALKTLFEVETGIASLGSRWGIFYNVKICCLPVLIRPVTPAFPLRPRRNQLVLEARAVLLQPTGVLSKIGGQAG